MTWKRIDVSKGLAYCQNDGGIYRDVLKQYAQESLNRREDIVDYYNKKDWENYGTYVHSLKSNSRMLGADTLADLAAGLEKAADNGDEETILRDHDKTMELYDKLVGLIRANIETGAPVVPDKNGHRILEFSPSEG